MLYDLDERLTSLNLLQDSAKRSSLSDSLSGALFDTIEYNVETRLYHGVNLCVGLGSFKINIDYNKPIDNVGARFGTCISCPA
eukprot:3697120-Prymnesium_polylepis.1